MLAYFIRLWVKRAPPGSHGREFRRFLQGRGAHRLGPANPIEPVIAQINRSGPLVSCSTGTLHNVGLKNSPSPIKWEGEKTLNL